MQQVFWKGIAIAVVVVAAAVDVAVAAAVVVVVVVTEDYYQAWFFTHAIWASVVVHLESKWNKLDWMETTELSWAHGTGFEGRWFESICPTQAARSYLIFKTLRNIVCSFFNGCIYLIYYFFSGFDWSELASASSLPSCDPSTCQNGGLCLPRPSSDDSPAEDSPFCLCQPGFTGPTCSQTMSTCQENPCLNGAPCSEDPSGGTGYECECSSSYQGRHCEAESARCVQNSCQNGGTCLNQPAGFLCECTNQFSGLRCENPARVRSSFLTNLWTKLSSSSLVAERS